MLGEEMRLGPGVVVVQNEASWSDRRRRFGMESPD